MALSVVVFNSPTGNQTDISFVHIQGHTVAREIARITTSTVNLSANPLKVSSSVDSG